MKICYLAAANSIHSYRWIKFFAERGHDVHWISLVPNQYERLENVHCYEHPARSAVSIDFIRAAFAVRRLIRDIAPDILHAHYAGTYGLVGAISRFHPFVVTAWGSDVLLGSRSFFKKPFVQHVLRKADLITCDADHMKEAMLRLGVPFSGIQIVYFGIDTKKFRPAERTDILRKKYGTSSAPVIMSLRNLEPIYNVESLVKAVPKVLKAFPKAQFLIAGTGSEDARLMSLSESLGITRNVKFIGRYPNNELPQYLNAVDIYVSTSLSDAGIAASTAEAMACGVPVVITDSGENSKWVADGEDGFVVPVQSPDILAERIVRLLHDGMLRKQFGERGSAIISKRNDYYKEMEKTENLYRDILHVLKN